MNNITSVNGSNSSEEMIDPVKVDQAIDQAYLDAGFKKKDESGMVVPDEEQMKAHVFELIQRKVVPDRQSRSDHSWTQGELYASTFSTAPGADGTDPDRLDATELEVRAKLMRKVWNLTNPGVQGFVQKRLGVEGTYVLCRGNVMRGLDEVTGVYITDDIDVIMSDSVDPQVEALVRKANTLRKHVEMIGTRHPELETRISGALTSGISRTRAALPAASKKNGPGTTGANGS
jgi:hypothetical protein